MNLSKLALNPRVTQLLVVLTPDTGCAGKLLAFGRTSTGGWCQELKSLAIVVGKSGISAAKQEGDNATPSGVFALGTAFGRETKPAWLNLDYRQICADDKFIDDPANPDYNRWVSGATNAKSYESMLREDGLYDLGVVIEYNLRPVIAGAGSAIFMHIWRGQSQGTEGCVALSFADLELLCRWLKKSANPHIYILPAGE